MAVMSVVREIYGATLENSILYDEYTTQMHTRANPQELFSAPPLAGLN